jgi:hypothetical protein
MPYIDDLKKYDPPKTGEFIRLEQGANKIRLVSHSFTFFQIYDQLKRVSYKYEKKEDAPAGAKVSQRWAWLVINRKDNSLGIIEVGWGIFKYILELAKNPDYGDPREYDLTINRTGEGLDTEYVVTPARQNTKLTKEEKEMIEKADLDLEGIYKAQFVGSDRSDRSDIETDTPDYDEAPMPEEPDF